MNNAVTNREDFTVLRNASLFITPLKLDSILGVAPGTCEQYAVDNPKYGVSQAEAVRLVTKFAPDSIEAGQFARHLMAVGLRAYIFSETGFC